MNLNKDNPFIWVFAEEDLFNKLAKVKLDMELFKMSYDRKIKIIGAEEKRETLYAVASIIYELAKYDNVKIYYLEKKSNI